MNKPLIAIDPGMCYRNDLVFNAIGGVEPLLMKKKMEELEKKKEERIISLKAKIEVLEEHIEHPNKPGYKRSDIVDKLKNLKMMLDLELGLKEDKPKKERKKTPNFERDHKNWVKSFYCDECGEHKMENFVYICTYANGESWRCKNCETEIMVDQEPNQDNY